MPSPERNDSGEISRVAVKLPQFWDKEADLWFINIEAQFILAGITQDKTKYYAVVSALNSEVLSYVSDIVKNPPTEDLYKTLKDRLIAEFSDSEQKRVKDLLSNAVLGDDKPSHLLRKMRQLANDKIGEEFLRTLWIQRLPKETQAILSVSEGNLDRLAQMADKIIDLNPHQVAETRISPPVHTYSQENFEMREMKAQIAALTDQVERLARGMDRPARDSRPHRRSSRFRRRSQTPNRQRTYEKCWYHYRYGDKATKCTPPCNFRETEN